MRYGLDVDGTACAFASRHCTDLMVGAGGLDQHHPFPLFLGGNDDETPLLLCPNHHRRQHSLIRYLVDAATPDWGVLQHFTPQERNTAIHAVDQWRAAGSPPVDAWNVPAARDA